MCNFWKGTVPVSAFVPFFWECKDPRNEWLKFIFNDVPERLKDLFFYLFISQLTVLWIIVNMMPVFLSEDMAMQSI